MAEAPVDEQLLKPNVLWAQRKDMILLRVKMQPLKKPDFTVHDTHLDFKAFGTVASGDNWYGFQLVFHEAIEPTQCRVRFLESEIEFRLRKKNSGPWPKLQSEHSKPHWIKIDFDHFEISDSEDEEKVGNNEMTPEMNELQKKLMEGVEMYKSVSDVTQMLKVGYLALYNAIQWIGFIVLEVILLYLLKDGQDGISRAYELGFPVIAVFQSLSVLEIVNNLLGLVKGGVAPSILQVGVRWFILFVCLYPVEAIHTHPIVYALFMVYALIELVRYPFYLASVLNYEIPLLSWLRYTMWIPLYPLGFICEATIGWLSLQNGPPGGAWSYTMPNQLNFSLSVNSIQILLMFVGPLGFWVLYSHMYAQRKKKLFCKTKTN